MEGSKIIITEITVSGLLEQMKDHSYYIGESLKSDGKLTELGAKIQASNDENPVLKDFVNTGVATISNLLTSALGITSYVWDTGKSKVLLTTNAVANFPDNQIESLKESIISYLSCHVLSNWLHLIKHDETIRFETLKKTIENDVIQLSIQRSKPKI